MAELEPHVVATAGILTLILSGSVVIWFEIGKRLLRRQPVLDWNEEPRAAWRSTTELAAVYLALLLTALSLLSLLSGEPKVVREPPTQQAILTNAGASMAFALLIPLVLVTSGQSWAGLGIHWERIGDQVRTGVAGYLAAVIPMVVSMLATIPIRGTENQHSLLKRLVESPDWLTVGVIAVAAVVCAPILEEMIYRLVLQGFFSTLLPARTAIPVVAGLFCLVHGWQNGVALLPLALILGYVFHRRHSYISVVVIHALFNATMLALQLLHPNPQ